MQDKRGRKFREILIQLQGLPRQDFARILKYELDDVIINPEECTTKIELLRGYPQNLTYTLTTQK